MLKGPIREIYPGRPAAGLGRARRPRRSPRPACSSPADDVPVRTEDGRAIVEVPGIDTLEVRAPDLAVDPMVAYIIKRIILMIPTLIGISMIAFMIIQLPPGDYLTSLMSSMADSGQTVDPAQMARMREIYGLDDPLWLQYWKWISGIVFRGDFGWSFEWGRPVSELIWERMGATLLISARLAPLRLVGVAADRHLLRGPPPLGRRPRLHLPRLPRPRHPELHHGADADVPLLPLLRAERRRPVLARVRRGALVLGEVRGPARATSGSRSSSSAPTAPPR